MKTKVKKEGSGERVNPTVFKQLVGSLKILNCYQASYNLQYWCFMGTPHQSHMQEANVFSDIQGTRDHEILYTQNQRCKIECFY